jgi:hypothetical protein
MFFLQTSCLKHYWQITFCNQSYYYIADPVELRHQVRMHLNILLKHGTCFDSTFTL